MRTHGLTPKQQLIAELLLKNKSTNEIAAELKNSVGTIKTHLAAMYRTFGVHTREEMTKILSKSVDSAIPSDSKAPIGNHQA